MQPRKMAVEISNFENQTPSNSRVFRKLMLTFTFNVFDILKKLSYLFKLMTTNYWYAHNAHILH